MSRRYGQSGCLVNKVNNWHVLFYVDLQYRCTRMSVPLGPIEELKKPEAKRKMRELLGQLGDNTEDHLLQAMNSTRTFEQESAWWRQNKLSLLKPSSQETMGSHIDKYLTPRFGELSIEA